MRKVRCWLDQTSLVRLSLPSPLHRQSSLGERYGGGGGGTYVPYLWCSAGNYKEEDVLETAEERGGVLAMILYELRRSMLPRSIAAPRNLASAAKAAAPEGGGGEGSRVTVSAAEVGGGGEGVVMAAELTVAELARFVSSGGERNQGLLRTVRFFEVHHSLSPCPCLQ